MWGKTNLIHSANNNYFSIDYLPSIQSGCGWLAVGTCQNTGIVWVNNGSTGSSEREQKMLPCASKNGVFYCSNFNLRNHVGEVRDTECTYVM